MILVGFLAAMAIALILYIGAAFILSVAVPILQENPGDMLGWFLTAIAVGMVISVSRGGKG